MLLSTTAVLVAPGVLLCFFLKGVLGSVFIFINIESSELPDEGSVT